MSGEEEQFPPSMVKRMTGESCLEFSECTEHVSAVDFESLHGNNGFALSLWPAPLSTVI